eukprot:scaffold113557_cov35-Tisochrysis_lutea.AAC.2
MPKRRRRGKSHRVHVRQQKAPCRGSHRIQLPSYRERANGESARGGSCSYAGQREERGGDVAEDT